MDEFDVNMDEFNVPRDELDVTKDELDVTRDKFDVTRDKFGFKIFLGTQMIQFTFSKSSTFFYRLLHRPFVFGRQQSFTPAHGQHHFQLASGCEAKSSLKVAKFGLDSRVLNQKSSATDKHVVKS
ncbi:hypothetical protein CDL15_Pgr004191 [Punica granatum]|uniref:Uncharacterized protein n=1 Tax=Punica granatum TaxID=22663 RepID=A0A218XH18_PUNGR|nr:hypothetical protein CDL15_Pgr004191 [Punica granatum]